MSYMVPQINEFFRLFFVCVGVCVCVCAVPLVLYTSACTYASGTSIFAESASGTTQNIVIGNTWINHPNIILSLYSRTS